MTGILQTIRQFLRNEMCPVDGKRHHWVQRSKSLVQCRKCGKVIDLR